MSIYKSVVYNENNSENNSAYFTDLRSAIYHALYIHYTLDPTIFKTCEIDIKEFIANLDNPIAYDGFYWESGNIISCASSISATEKPSDARLGTTNVPKTFDRLKKILTTDSWTDFDGKREYPASP